MTAQNLVFVGTYSTRDSVGVYVFRLDPETGALTRVGSTAAQSPSFLALSPSRRFLYAVNELNELNGEPLGAASAFSLDPQTGALRLINKQPVGGRHPCHIHISPSGRWVFVANYVDGTHTILPIAPDGGLGEATAIVSNAGAGEPAGHAHSTQFSPDGRFVYACDLGLDRVLVYTFDDDQGALTLVSQAQLPAGAGPRHLVFHPRLPMLYVINELNGTVSAMVRDQASGALNIAQSLPALPAGHTGRVSCADIHLSTDARFLYGSNRGHDSLATYSIDAGGFLTALGHVWTGGREPRNFAVLDNGLILAANEHTDNIVAFRIGNDGIPVPTGAATHVPSPVCILPYPSV